jgi:hypothetical protein
MRPDDPACADTDQQLREVARILAAGLRRLHGRPAARPGLLSPPENPPESVPNCLDPSSEPRLSVTRGLTPAESPRKE